MSRIRHSLLFILKTSGRQTREIKKTIFYEYFDKKVRSSCLKMKVKVLSRNPDEYLRETKRDIHKSK